MKHNATAPDHGRRWLLAGASALLAGNVIASETPAARLLNKLVTPGAPGGIGDTITRALARGLIQVGGPGTMVENIPGAGGAVAVNQYLDGTSDAPGIFIGHASLMGIMPNMRPSPLKSDLASALAAIDIFGMFPHIIVARSSATVRDCAEHIAQLRQRGDPLVYSTVGNGTTAHFAGELLGSLARIPSIHVPYKAASLAAVDVASGQVPLGILDFPSVRSLIANGSLRYLGVTSRHRSSQAPDVPTLHELGYAGFDIQSWMGAFLPSRTPLSMLGELNSLFRRARKTAGTTETLKSTGMDQADFNIEASRDFVQADAKKWSRLIVDLKIML